MRIYLRIMKICQILVGAMLGCCVAKAAPVTIEAARTAAENWAARSATLDCRFDTSATSGRTCMPKDGLPFHVVRFNEGGFAVLSSDNEFEPIIAFSEVDDLIESDDNPLWILLCKDSHARKAALGHIPPRRANNGAKSEEWNKLLDSATRASSDVSAVSDVRVAPLIKSKWGQSTVNYQPCYNYYTPGNYPCGCVATAGAQLMRYFEWPQTSMTPFTCNWCAVDGEATSLTTQGGIYNWADMPLVPTSSITTSQRKAIGNLTSDIGICCGMNYRDDGSGAGSYMLTSTMIKHFGYSNAVAFFSMNENVCADVTSVKNALVSNFDAGLPVCVSINGDDGGHAIVGDGYGYLDNTLYYHFNFGWSGTADAWYAPPDLDAGEYAFNVLDGFVYNIYTNQAAGASICSGRILDSNGNPVSGAIVSAKKVTGATAAATTSNNQGIYALILPPASYLIEARYGTIATAKDVSLAACVSLEVCDDDDEWYGCYWTSPVPSVGNLCDQDMTLGNIACVATPVISPAPCTFHPSVTVSMSCETANASIYYTLDGTDPLETGNRYTSPITLTRTTTVKARAFCDGLSPSLVATAVYTYDAGQDAVQGDFFSNPINITGLAGTNVVADISAFTREDDEPIHTLVDDSWYNFYNTAWFEWTAPITGEATLTSNVRRKSGSTVTRYPTMMAVYAGDSISSIERIGVSTDYNSGGNYVTALSFDCVKGKTYRIVCMLGTANVASAAPLTLTWDTTPLTEWYVDASAAQGGSGHAASPFKSISAALAAAAENNTIHVLPGVYFENLNVVGTAVDIVAEEGPAVTILDGRGLDSCYYDDGKFLATLNGFTLRNGYYEDYGGAVYGGVLRNCVIRDSIAYSGAGAYYSELYDCVLIGNHAMDYGGAAACSYLERCTVIGNTTDGTGAGLDGDCVAVNSIVWNNTLASGRIENWETYESENGSVMSHLAFCCTEPMPENGSDNICEYPCFVFDGNTDDADWRLRSASPCLSAGSTGCNMGAYQGEGVSGYVVTASVVGHGCVTPRVAVVEAGGEATFTATAEYASRPFEHFDVDGEMASESEVLTLSNIQGDHDVTAVFHVMEFHVDAATGSDSDNSGESWDNPLRTIQRAVDLNLGGELILVKPGCYDYVVVDSVPVTICSTDGASATTIRGSSGHSCFTAYGIDSILAGFTLRDGANTGRDGGGAFNGTLLDCVITNCAAKNGGGAAYSILMNCLVAGNRATECGGGAFYCTLLSCTIAGNSAGLTAGGAYSLGDTAAYNSIVAGNTASAVSGASGIADMCGNGVKCFTDGDPLFVDPAHGDYRLAGGSPCIDAGYNELAPADTDLVGDARISGAAIDLGCYEYSQEISVSPKERIESAAAQTCVIDICADGEWTLSSDSNWLSASPANGMGDATVTLSLSANDSGAERIGAIVMTGEGANGCVTLPVTQIEGTTGGGTYRGLFIGVNTYTSKSLRPLNGCVPDALAMRGRCLANGLWTADTTSILTNNLATKAAIRAGIASLAADAVGGDTVLIYQSSHGGNSIGNNRDSYLCATDDYYYDYEMAADISAFATGVRVIVILDTCHSAGMFKSASAYPRLQLSGASSSAVADDKWNFANRVIAQMEARKYRVYANAAARSNTSPHYASQPDVAFITAADYDQYSLDGYEGGAFTSAFLYGWQTGEADADADLLLNFRELYDYAAIRAIGIEGHIEDRTQPQCYNERMLLRTLARKIVPPEIYEPANAYYDDFREWLYQNQMVAFSEIDNPARIAEVAQSAVAGESENALYYFIVCGDRYASLESDERILTALIDVNAQGEPVVTWTPDLNAASMAPVRKYTILGSLSLPSEWKDVTELSSAARAAAGYRFFKVSARMP